MVISENHEKGTQLELSFSATDSEQTVSAQVPASRDVASSVVRVDFTRSRTTNFQVFSSPILSEEAALISLLEKAKRLGW